MQRPFSILFVLPFFAPLYMWHGATQGASSPTGAGLRRLILHVLSYLCTPFAYLYNLPYLQRCCCGCTMGVSAGTAYIRTFVLSNKLDNCPGSQCHREAGAAAGRCAAAQRQHIKLMQKWEHPEGANRAPNGCSHSGKGRKGWNLKFIRICRPGRKRSG